MKTIVIAVLCLLAGFAIAGTKPRMRILGSEVISDGTWDTHFDYFHDRETGQEIVCVNYKTCYLTGRVWSDEPGQRIPSQ